MPSLGKKLFLEQAGRDGAQKSPAHRQLFSMVIWFVRRYPIPGAVVVGLMFVGSLAEGVGLVAVIPLLGLVLTSDIETNEGFGGYINAALAIVGIELSALNLVGIVVVAILLKALMRYLAIKIAGDFSAEVAKSMRQELLGKIIGVEWQYFVSNKTGEIAAALTHAADKASATGVQIAKFFSMFFQICVVVFLSAMVSWQITLLALVFGAVTFFVLGGFVRMARVAGVEQTEVTSRFTSRLLDSIGAIKPIKAMGSEAQIVPLLNHDVEQLCRSQKKLVRSSVMLEVVPEPIATLAIVLALLVILYSSTVMAEPEVALGLMILFARILMSLHTIQGIYKNIAVGQAAFSFVRQLDTRLGLKQESASTGLKHTLQTAIEFHNVKFGYKDRPILAESNLQIPVGSIVSITGPSGVGKTTTIDLIIGLIESSAGQVLIDGHDIRDLDRTHWRDQIGYVPQETFLFNESILQNITFGDQAISREKVLRALSDARALNFVNLTEFGLDSVVGEHGMKLSGGQRQRLSIARALVRDPRLLILDESTSSLDPESEQGICETLISLRQIRPDLTVVNVSHQPALVEIADFVYSILDGKTIRQDIGITESGGTPH